MNHLQLAHLLMEATVRPGDHVCDMTLGNGHDMRKLLTLCGDTGQFTGYDISEQAIRTCRQIAAEYPNTRIRLRHESHVHCEDLEPVRFAVYNLGYLPGSDKLWTTTADTTVRSLATLATRLLPGGMICLTAYRTHDGGEEAEKVRAWLSVQPDLHVRSWERIPDDGHCPILYAITRRQVRP